MNVHGSKLRNWISSEIHGRVAFLFWLVLLFIQPFEKFVAVKYLLMFGLLVLAVPLGMRPEIRHRLLHRSAVLNLALAIVVWCIAVSVIGVYVADSLHALSRDLLLQAELLLMGCVLVRNAGQARVALSAIVAGFAVFSLLSTIEVGSYLMDHSLSEGEIPRSHRSFWGGYAIMAGFCLPLVIAFAVSCVSNVWQRVMLFVLVALAVVLTS